NGEASITVETALLLENALGGSASFWINLEKNHQETKARIERLSFLKEELPLLPKFPYPELVKRGCVEAATDLKKKVENLWKFFGVNSLQNVCKTEEVAFRARSGDTIKSESIAAWLRCGELDAKKQTLSKFSELNLKNSLSELRSLTIKPANEFSGKVREILNKAGVALVYTQHFSGTGVSGAVRWIGENPVMQLSVLGSYADMFWFNLFHEIGHLVLHGKKDKFIEFDKRDLSIVQEKEREADKFATDQLINAKDYFDFINKEELSKQSIQNFAKQIGIDAGIVAGRLCHDKQIDWRSVSSLRQRLKIVRD
ncbi:ImmA/IrrE family metallo-endopeptidase, partial [Patescibacteria group bacterium]|nr:ImmA/IrrE family metallo-endopeptidase [Patescibacteria group bacterium]